MIRLALAVLSRVLGGLPLAGWAAGICALAVLLLIAAVLRLDDARRDAEAARAAAAVRVERLEAELVARAEAAAVHRASAARLARLAADRAARIRDLEALGGADAPLSPRLSAGARRLWGGAAD